MTLSEHKTAVESLDKQIIDLVDEQLESSSDSKSAELQTLKMSLARRTQKQLMEIEQRKQS